MGGALVALIFGYAIYIWVKFFILVVETHKQNEAKKRDR